MRIAIVGYGILGMVAADLLHEEGFEVHIFDLDSQAAGHEYFPEPTGPHSLSHPLSSPKGSPGNLEYWGRAISSFIPRTSEWPIGFISNLSRYGSVLRRYGFPKLKLQTLEKYVAFLKVSFSNIEVFKKTITRIAKDSKVIRHNSLVYSLAQKGDNKISLTTLGSGDDFEEFLFDRIVVCAGPVRSFNLISSSGLIPTSSYVEMLDHPTFWLGDVTTLKPVLIKSRLRNRAITFGSKPGAIVTTLENGNLLTIRIRPKIKSKRKIKAKTVFDSFSFFFKSEVLAKFGFFYCDEFSIAVSFDCISQEIVAILSDIGEVAHFAFTPSNLNVDAEILKKVESVILENLGIFNKNWKRSSGYSETAAAHYAGLLGRFKDSEGNAVMEGFHIRKYPEISVPGSVSFPDIVVGHPTYLALCSVVFEVERIKSHFKSSKI